MAHPEVEGSRRIDVEHHDGHRRPIVLVDGRGVFIEERDRDSSELIGFRNR